MVQISPSTDRQERQTAILAGAARVFRRRGLQATGMREIAAELGMAVGNLYYYFRDKGELLAFCQLQALERLVDGAEAIRAEAARPPAKLGKLILAHLRCLHEEIPGSLAHLEVDALEAGDRAAVVAQRDRYEGLLRATVEEGIGEGAFRPVDAAIAVRSLLGALNWTVRWYRPEGPLGVEPVAEEMASLFLEGLGAGTEEQPSEDTEP